MKNSKTSRGSRTSQEGRRSSSGRMNDENGRFSSDDGGYYSNRNFGSRNERETYGRQGGRSGADQWSDYNDTRRESGTYGGGNWDRSESGSQYGSVYGSDRSRGSERSSNRDNERSFGRDSERSSGRDSERSSGKVSERSSGRDSGYNSGRGSYGREYDEMDSSRRSQGSRYAPYRSSEQDYEANSRWDNDGYGKSTWNRPDGDRSERSERESSQRDSQRSSRWGKEDFGWGGTMSGRDQETGYNTDMTDEDNYGDLEGISGGRSARFSDVDDVEGQYDEDYRDRDSYSHSRRSNSNSRSNHGSRR